MKAEQESGIGGKMVRTKKATNASRQKAGNEAGGKGAAMMTKLADEKLREEGQKVIDKLVENALEGNVSCARLLLDLSAKSVKGKAGNKRRRLHGLANALSSEPEWMGESSEETAEIACGSREPED
jgi:hypothetical protein